MKRLIIYSKSNKTHGFDLRLWGLAFFGGDS